MNNEPVAWRKSETDSEGQYFVYREEEPRWLEGYIPLYTHPHSEESVKAKTLSIREIHTQQQIEIEALKILLKKEEDTSVSELREAQKNEPSWSDIKWNWALATALQKKAEKAEQVLTDEEIFDCATKSEFQYSEEKGIYVKHSNGSWICIGNRLMDFAKAILKKASEK